MSHGASAAWSNARRVLAVRLDSLGDVLMTSPALRALARAAPGRRLTLLTSPAGAEAARLIPEVDDVIVYQSPWMKSTPVGRPPALDQEMISLLASRRFDAAVIFTVYSQSPLPAALLLHLSGVPLRLAYCRENPYHLLDGWLPESEPEQELRHEVVRHLDLVRAAGAISEDDRLRLEPGTKARASVDALLERLALAGSREWIVVHPGASAASRRYPPARFARVLRLLHQERGIRPLLTGSIAEKRLAGEVISSSGVPAVDLSGELDLPELCALLERAPLLLANNTGPVHVASGVGTPVVDLYALTNPQHTPWRVPSKVLYNDVPCRFCYRSECPEGHHMCLAGVAPERVAAATLDLLDETESGIAAPAPAAGAVLALANEP